MRLDFAEQYGVCCIIIEPGDTADAVIERAHADEATYEDGDGVLICAQFPGRPQEVYTEDAIRRSLRTNGTCQHL